MVAYAPSPSSFVAKCIEFTMSYDSSGRKVDFDSVEVFDSLLNNELICSGCMGDI